ncbi:beta-ketoacyl synthase N-terminal-like domain-containing protein [Haloflavibacter putidus]|uniref:3-oxoacyl-ACP synthase n=1 Tax=Haloflavibacter putidus TaxID=2576776 RepID=A0A507ZR24_9FLAO|nr:beta-ketoacyl synthase N-terminal-like domain-containing protein [Haloflavibacter putidus]TQD40196.1 3-oxoacyl-ACP synthase [Haloflavibacter putidus]
MEPKIYINGTGSISAQKASLQALEGPNLYNAPVLKHCFTDFKKYISPREMRRMSTAVKLGVAAANASLEDANVKELSGILVGTGMGCKQDSDIFLEDMLQNKEDFLTPTKFIQSTHNTVSGQIALQLDCKAYNTTYVQSSVSFESAFLDAEMELQTAKKHKNYLVGGVDEISDYSIDLQRLDGQIKEENFTNTHLMQHISPGSIIGEGASFFVLSNFKKANSYAQYLGNKIYNQLQEDEVEMALRNFLQEKEITLKDIDAIILGQNAMLVDQPYFSVFSQGKLQDIPQLYYKHLVGEFYTASAYAFWLACHILKEGKIPQSCKLNQFQIRKKPEYILLYNVYRGKNHSFSLLRTC